MALTLGTICAEEPTLVRVHNMDPLRDLFMVKQPGRWSLRAAMAEVAEAGSGVVLLLGNPLNGQELLAHLERQLGTDSKLCQPDDLQHGRCRFADSARPGRAQNAPDELRR